jgi:iron complex transport system substrate-binding protein
LKLTLFARKGVAMSLAVSREAFLLPVDSEEPLAAPWRRIFAVGIASALLSSVPPQTSALGKFSGDAAAPNGVARVVTDEVGRTVSVPADVRRIVTLAPNLTEIVYALGLDDRLAGDTNYCETPPAAKLKPHVGDPQDPSLEAIVALHPDLVLATTSINRVATADALKRLGIPVYTSDPRTVRGILESIARMANLMGAAPQGAALEAQLQARLDALRARLKDEPPLNVLFVVWVDPLGTVGQNTFIADALRWAGARSVIQSKQNYPRVSFEEVVRLEPDYIVLTADHEGAEESEGASLRARPGWSQIRAVQEGHIAVVGDEWDRPSPGLIDGIEELARELHPDVFALKTAALGDTVKECACVR